MSELQILNNKQVANFVRYLLPILSAKFDAKAKELQKLAKANVNNFLEHEEVIEMKAKHAIRIEKAKKAIELNKVLKEIDPNWIIRDTKWCNYLVSTEIELEDLLKEVSKEMDEFRFSLVAEKLYHYFWHTFADIIIERSKKKILENNNANSAKVLLYLQLTTLLKALHPFIPFITEEIWSTFRKENIKLLMVEEWPYIKE